MYTRLFILLFLIFSSRGILAQHGIDAFPLPGKVSSFKLMDVKQQKITRLETDDKPLSLFIFLSPECPLSQNYTKTVNGLRERFMQQVNFFGIIPGNAYTIKDIAGFENKYHTEFTMLIDTRQNLTHYLKATATPQAFLVDNKGNLVYAGAIDDWVQGLGKKKPQASQHYVRDAIEQSLRGELVKIKKTRAFGCKINDY